MVGWEFGARSGVVAVILGVDVWFWGDKGSDTCFLNTFERDERTESEITQRPSYAAETTQDVAVMMQGMFHVKRKVPGLSSLARCDGPSV